MGNEIRFCLNEDGISMLIDEITLYHEEFSTNSNFRIGDVEKTLYKCRNYCDFNGKPIKRNKIQIYSSIGVLSKKHKIIFEKYQQNYSIEYNRTNNINKDLIRQIFLEYYVSQKIFEEFSNSFLMIKEHLIKKNEFIWGDFVDIVNKIVPDFNYNNFLKYGYVSKEEPGFLKIKLRFDSLNYKVQNKCTMFNNVILL
jgi:hypothetical protein